MSKQTLTHLNRLNSPNSWWVFNFFNHLHPWAPKNKLKTRFEMFDIRTYHPWKLTCPQKRDYFSKEYIFQPLIFRGHVSFQGSKLRNTCRWFRNPKGQPPKWDGAKTHVKSWDKPIPFPQLVRKHRISEPPTASPYPPGPRSSGPVSFRGWSLRARISRHLGVQVSLLGLEVSPSKNLKHSLQETNISMVHTYPYQQEKIGKSSSTQKCRHIRGMAVSFQDCNVFST